MRVTVLRGEYTICDEAMVTVPGRVDPRPEMRTTVHDAAGKKGTIVALSVHGDEIIGAQVQLDGAAPTDRYHYPLDALAHEDVDAAAVSAQWLPLTLADLPVDMVAAVSAVSAVKIQAP